MPDLADTKQIEAAIVVLSTVHSLAAENQRLIQRNEELLQDIADYREATAYASQVGEVSALRSELAKVKAERDFLERGLTRWDRLLRYCIEWLWPVKHA